MLDGYIYSQNKTSATEVRTWECVERRNGKLCTAKLKTLNQIEVGRLSGGQTNATTDATFDPTLLHPMLRSFGHPVFSVTKPSNNVASSIQQNEHVHFVGCLLQHDLHVATGWPN